MRSQTGVWERERTRAMPQSSWFVLRADARALREPAANQAGAARAALARRGGQTTLATCSAGRSWCCRRTRSNRSRGRGRRRRGRHHNRRRNDDGSTARLRRGWRGWRGRRIGSDLGDRLGGNGHNDRQSRGGHGQLLERFAARDSAGRGQWRRRRVQQMPASQLLQCQADDLGRLGDAHLLGDNPRQLFHAGIAVAVSPDQRRGGVQAVPLVTLVVIEQRFVEELADGNLLASRSVKHGRLSPWVGPRDVVWRSSVVSRC